MRTWTAAQIEAHREVNRRLEAIGGASFRFLREKGPRLSEYELQQFALKEFRRLGLVPAKDYPLPIVAFGPSGDDPHYTPTRQKSRRLQTNTLIMLDLWGRLSHAKSPFGDLTWMAFYGRTVPAEIKKAFAVVIAARDAGIAHAKKILSTGRIPCGAEIHAATRRVLATRGLGAYIKHRTGHSIGTDSPHGTAPHVNDENPFPLLRNLGYTIEPGIYVPKRFGVRSEMNFLIRNRKFEATSALQKKLVLL